ncbi:hypothetical protein O7626_01560 [Micromonospora sp. WMMD1102]|uniref:hypothetical protein n=1 Tax=Micromonospora sp. WMMD1102 TaxID=3016105 RepID=UPI002414E94D|nr:hypothetical protein [Micromonospora sp. WMMD1102]MDG4784633.1 hypothetical protein [Micromonospora sp. WMMD1102]
MEIIEAAPTQSRTTARRSRAWRRATRVAVVGVLAGAAVGLAASPSLAATGRIVISSPAGASAVLVNPAAGCRDINGTFPAGTTVSNQTDSTIVVYTGRACTVPSATLPPGGSTGFSSGSIRVLS